MNKLYNTQEEIATKIKQIFKKIIPNVKKTTLNILPYIIIDMFLSESIVASEVWQLVEI